MALTYSKAPITGTPCPDFSLIGTDGNTYSRATLSHIDGIPVDAFLVMFICNHCPYVKAVESRIVELANGFKRNPQTSKKVSIVGISSNDGVSYPEDSFGNMKQKNYPFPYLYDESQETAASFGAVCTPDFFLYNRELKLSYRGRLDDSWKDASLVRSRDLFLAMKSLLQNQTPSPIQKSSMGCSIKWKPGNEPPPERSI